MENTQLYKTLKIMNKLSYILIVLLAIWFLAIMLIIKCFAKPEIIQDSDYDYRIYKPIETNNRDSLAMMLSVRGSNDSLLRVQCGL